MVKEILKICNFTISLITQLVDTFRYFQRKHRSSNLISLLTIKLSIATCDIYWKLRGKKRHKELVYHVAGISRKFLAQWQINDLMSIGKRLSPLCLSRVSILFVFVLLEYVLVLCAPPRSSFGFFTYLCLLGC